MSSSFIILWVVIASCYCLWWVNYFILFSLTATQQYAEFQLYGNLFWFATICKQCMRRNLFGLPQFVSNVCDNFSYFCSLFTNELFVVCDFVCPSCVIQPDHCFDIPSFIIDIFIADLCDAHERFHPSISRTGKFNFICLFYSLYFYEIGFVRALPVNFTICKRLV